MTTRPVERRHREAAVRARWPWSLGNGEPLQEWQRSWVEETGDYTGSDRPVLHAIAQALANAEQPAPSAPAEFDPWEALAPLSMEVGHCSDGSWDLIALGPNGWETVNTPHPPKRAEALRLCELLGLTESPKGKEDTNG